MIHLRAWVITLMFKCINRNVIRETSSINYSFSIKTRFNIKGYTCFTRNGILRAVGIYVNILTIYISLVAALKIAFFKGRLSTFEISSLSRKETLGV